jgi:hypothetical protein
MSRTKYDLMAVSSGISDGYGNFYPDIATFSINSFVPTSRPLKYSLNETDVYRFDTLINSYYGNFELYDDLTLWLNDIPYLTSGYIGSGIKFYNKANIDDWYTKNS